MKNLIGILLLFVSTNVFGQGGSVFNQWEIEARFIYTGNSLRQHNIIDPTTENWGRITYQFVANGKQYLVSYEQCETCKHLKNGESGHRNLYLYRWDSIEFNIAVDKPLRVDNFSYDDDWNLTCDCFFPQMHGGNANGWSEEKYKDHRISDAKYDGYIKKLDNGYVEIKLQIFVGIKQHGISYKYYNEIITLKPNDNDYIIINKLIIKD